MNTTLSFEEVNNIYGYKITFPPDLTAYIKITCFMRKFSGSAGEAITTNVGEITGNIDKIYEYSGANTGTDCSSPPITSHVNWFQQAYQRDNHNAMTIITMKVTAGSNNTIFLYGNQNLSQVQSLVEIEAYNGYDKSTCERNNFKNSVTNQITSQTIWSA